MHQIPLPQKYVKMTEFQIAELIDQRKKQFGKRLVILGHHYQCDNTIRHADFTGDSLELSRIAAQQKDVEFIVFCGVHFMAESADILSAEEQKVILPDMTAGCSMADMAEIDQVEQCWQTLCEEVPNPHDLIPVTYVNSTAAIKAFCGHNGGICVTSSNCRVIFEHIWKNNPEAIILFLPDEYLGRNTAYQMGNTLETMALWDPYQKNGGLTQRQIASAKIILWKGFCSVHQEFTIEQITQIRREEPGTKIIVHPECCFQVAQEADLLGSTAYIIEFVSAAEPGTSWAVGTEINLVKRLTQKMAPKNIKVRSLSETTCLCETMYRIDPAHLAWIMDSIAVHIDEPQKVGLLNRVSVREDIKQQARIALEKMLEITTAAETERQNA